MKLKSNKSNWATVLCAAAVFSLITLREAQAAGNGAGILPPPPISDTNDGTGSAGILPPPPIDDDLGGEGFSGEFSGSIVD